MMNEEERQHMLKDLEREAANDLRNFLQDVADGIKQPTKIQTDEKWPTI
jgi:ribosome recycling factor